MAPLGLLTTGASFAASLGLHWGLQRLPTPGSAAHGRCKWRNMCVSLAHSLLAGPGLSLYPQMTTDPIHGHPPWAPVLTPPIPIPTGYFLTLGQAWELLCHHLVVASCLSSTVPSDHYMGISMLSLGLGLNSACLHLWKLLLLSYQAPSLALGVTRWAPLATLALFRLVPLRPGMSLWLLQQHKQVPLALVVLGGIGLVTVGVMSITLGVHILVIDVLQSWPHQPIPGHKETKGTRTCWDDKPVTMDDSTLTFSLKD
uniref:Uncharacterized protein n=1 Tax=Microcebus murinus TaxID=30608 RepID=A0A8C5UI11_MICMU